MSVPPLLSSTPPPLDENESVHDHNDEFGEFSDYASVGVVSSTTSVVDSSSVFQPVETPDPHGGLRLDDSSTEVNNLEETDEWSEFGAAVVHPVSESVPCDSDDLNIYQKTVSTESCDRVKSCISDDVPDEADNGDLPIVSSLTSRGACTEQLNVDDVMYGCQSDLEVKSNDENSDCGKCIPDLSEDLTDSATLPCLMVKGEHSVEDDESSVSDNHDLAINNSDICAVEQSDINENAVSTFAVSDQNEDAVADDYRSTADEYDSVDNFQSFTSDVETCQRDVAEDGQLSICNIEQPSFLSCEELEASTCVETSSAIALHSASTQAMVAVSESEFALSMTAKASTSDAHEDETVPTNQFTRGQMPANSEEFGDDFDDFEEFVAANDGPNQQRATADASAYQWSAFENTAAAADNDDWAAFQDSGQPLSTNLAAEIDADSVAGIQHSPVTYSDHLSKDSLSHTLSVCFRSSKVSDPDAVMTPLHRAFECPDASPVYDSRMSKETGDKVAVWSCLRVMENTPALKYNWPQSHCSDLLLRAIDVDARNILNPPRKSATPAFATHLGLLEPKKAVPDPFGSASADTAAPHGNLPFSLDHAKQRPADATASGRSVDFKKQEKELLEVLELPDCGATQNTKSHSSSLDSILKAITSSTASTNSSLSNAASAKDGMTEPLSAEASAVLARLPDLSFMHSKVLMFPVSDCAN